MASFATFGNELYTGKRSYDFVGSKKIWFLVAAVAVALSILLPVVKGGFNLGSNSAAVPSSPSPTSRPRMRRSARMP